MSIRPRRGKFSLRNSGLEGGDIRLPSITSVSIPTGATAVAVQVGSARSGAGSSGVDDALSFSSAVVVVVMATVAMVFVMVMATMLMSAVMMMAMVVVMLSVMMTMLIRNS
ncbi:hypothetical protein V8F33_008437 [Rhypophila sp. PSN 637]